MHMTAMASCPVVSSFSFDILIFLLCCAASRTVGSVRVQGNGARQCEGLVR
jgi:hypothetical protein